MTSSASESSRRSFLKRAGAVGAGTAVAAGAALPAPASADGGRERRGRDGYLWLAGDHHVHGIYSNDGVYRVIDQARHAANHGLDWMVITDHGNTQHSTVGVDKVVPDIRATRKALPDLLLFHGLEWNIPGAEHGTLFVAPGRDDAKVLKEFESRYDARVNGTRDGTPANEALAIEAFRYLDRAVATGRLADAIFLANHPCRLGIDSPHELRAWRDAAPRIAVGMEGAPGHQGAGLPAPYGQGRGRGLYDGAPSAFSFPGLPQEAYRTFGGFDWFTSTVGGMWDSLLAEGKPWSITANSDAHGVYLDTVKAGPAADFERDGFIADPVHGGTLPHFDYSDFWPGFYSRTHVGAERRSYRSVIEGIRAGRVWVDHGGLISGLDVSVRDLKTGATATLGGSLKVRCGSKVALRIRITLPAEPNWAQFIPKLARVDVIQGDVTGPVADRDALYAPGTRVVTSFEVDHSQRTVEFSYPLGAIDRPIYVRLRGTDGQRSAVGVRGAAVDPAGPAIDEIGNADPWADLWFYSNPIFVAPRP